MGGDLEFMGVCILKRGEGGGGVGLNPSTTYVIALFRVLYELMNS